MGFGVGQHKVNITMLPGSICRILGPGFSWEIQVQCLHNAKDKYLIPDLHLTMKKVIQGARDYSQNTTKKKLQFRFIGVF